jgi:hypothetical protein
MTTYLIEIDGVTPVTNPDGSVTLRIPTPAASSIAVVGLVGMTNNISGSSDPLPGAQVGDTVSYIAVVYGTTSIGGATQDLSTFFETTISVAGHIQQLGPITPTPPTSDAVALVVLTRAS